MKLNTNKNSNHQRSAAMKLTSYKTIVLLLTILPNFMTSLHAQNRHLIRNQGFYYAFEGFYSPKQKLTSNYVIDTKAFSPKSYGLKATANWFLNYHLSTGVGLAVLNYESPGMFTFPVLGNIQAYWSKGSNTPFVFAEGGYGFRLNHKNQDKGLLYELGVGYRYRIKWENFLVFKVGYHSFQNNEWLWGRRREQPIDPLNAYRWYDLRRQSLTITLGFYYSTRY